MTRKSSVKGKVTDMHPESDISISADEIARRLHCSIEEGNAIIRAFSDERGVLGDKEFRFLQDDMTIMQFLSDLSKPRYEL